MSSSPQLFRVNVGSTQSEKVVEVEFADLGLREPQDIEEWVAATPGILGEDLMIVSRQFRGFDRTRERPDLLAVDSDGKLVIVELKRDDSGADVHWQAIKYASYFRRATASDVVAMCAEYMGITVEDAENQLLEHIDADDLTTLNNDQRIVLVSHRFAPEVTSAVLWINEKTVGENLISCVTLTPYRDANADSLYVQAATIIPLPGVENYVVGIGSAGATVGSMGRPRRGNQNVTDDITVFAKRVHDLTRQMCPRELWPEQRSRWAGGNVRRRWCNFWYSRPPWANRLLCYRLDLRPQIPDRWRAGIWIRDRDGFATPIRKDERLHENQTAYKNGIYFEVGTGALDDDFAERIAEALRSFIERVTPLVDDLYMESSLQADAMDGEDDEAEELETQV